MSPEELQAEIEALFEAKRPAAERARSAVSRLFDALEAGEVRAAEPGGDSAWRVHAWVKQGILLAFRVGEDRSGDLDPVFHFRDRDTLPTRGCGSAEGAPRIVPGGTTIRRGSRFGSGVVVMPPSYVNVGAWIDDGTMVDSHVLVGSCAQIGRNVHLSAGVQIGGVLEPIGARPVIVEDGAFVGGSCGVYEGARVGEGAILAAGVVLTRSVPVHDLVRKEILRGDEYGAPSIPPGAVVVPGARPAAGEFAAQNGIQLQAPVIVKYRDGKSDAAVELERALR